MSGKPTQAQAENSSPEHRLSFKQQYYSCSGPKRWLQRGERESERAIPSGPPLLTSAASIHPSPVLPGHTGTWQHQEEILTELKARREIREAESGARAGPALDKHTSLICDTHMWETHTQGPCAPVWLTLSSSLDIDPNLTPVNENVCLTASTVIVIVKGKASNLNKSKIVKLRKGNVADNVHLPHLSYTLQIHSVTHLTPNDSS